MYMTVQSYILALLEGDPVKGKIKVVHQLFLIAKEIAKEKGDFKFFPYQFGPYSTVVAEQFNSLIDQGHVKHSKAGNTHLFELTDSGRKLLGQQDLDTDIVEKIQSLKKSTANHRVKDMVAIIRAKYPQYLVNARI